MNKLSLETPLKSVELAKKLILFEALYISSNFVTY